MPIEEQVAELERKMGKIREDYQAGRITRDEIEQQASSLTIKHLGYYWAIGHETGQWYYYNDGEWHWSESPLHVKEEDFLEVSASEIEEKVAELEHKVRQFYRDYATGRISELQFEQLRQSLFINYLGRRWTIGIVRDRQRWYRPEELISWYRQRGNGFLKKSNSPLLVSPEDLVNDSSFFGIDDRSNVIEFNLNQSQNK